MTEPTLLSGYAIGIISGIISGIIVTGVIWLFKNFSKKNGILRPTGFTMNPDQITVKNIGKFNLSGFELSGQISFLENHRRKIYYIKVDEQFSYHSQRVLNPYKSRIYDINVQDCIPNHNFQSFQDVINQFRDNDIKLTVFITYYGQFTNILKRVSEEFELE